MLQMDEPMNTFLYFKKHVVTLIEVIFAIKSIKSIYAVPDIYCNGAAFWMPDCKYDLLDALAEYTSKCLLYESFYMTRCARDLYM